MDNWTLLNAIIKIKHLEYVLNLLMLEILFFFFFLIKKELKRCYLVNNIIKLSPFSIAIKLNIIPLLSEL